MKFRVVTRREGAADEARVVEAPTRFGVYDLVRDAGGTVVTISEYRALFDFSKLLHLNLFGSGVKQAHLMVMTKNLGAMLSAGLSLARALSVAERQAGSKRLKAIVAMLGDSISRGNSFHGALAEHREVFSPLYIAMVRAGEESGALAGALSAIASQMEKSYALVRKIRGAMIYPAIVLTAVIVVAILMLIFVVPTLTATFTALGVKVPLATRIISGLSSFIVNHLIAVLLIVATLVLLAFLFVRSKPGGRTMLALALHVPVVGALVRETYTARAARTLSSLLASGVPVLSALEITEEVIGARRFANVVKAAAEKVRKGEPLSQEFAAHSELYPILMSDMLAVGEETGKVTEMLGQVAAFYEEDVEQKTKDLSTVIEPVLMLFVGVMVGIFAVAMIAPIYSLSSAI